MGENVELKLLLEDKQFQKAIKSAQTAFMKLNKAVKKTNGSTNKAGEGLKGVGESAKKAGKGFKLLDASMGGALLSFTAVGVTLLALKKSLDLVIGTMSSMIAQAGDFEEAFTGVRKVTEATDAQFRSLEKGLISMSKVMPVTATEFANIAESAGRLGVPIKNVEKFTKTIAMLGVATELTSEQASIEFARLTSITGEPLENIDRLGSAITQLGNEFATNEPEILTFALRIASAGAIAGLATVDMLAFGSAFASIGIQAEAGGTAISKLLFQIKGTTQDGGKKLEALANIAGQTGAQFKQSFEADAGLAVADFIEGLGKIQRAGGNSKRVLETLNITNSRSIASILGMANAQGQLGKAIRNGRKAYQENVALVREATLRFGDYNSKVIVLENNISALAIELGTQLLPITKSVVDGFIGLTSEFSKAKEESAKVLTAVIWLANKGFNTVIMSAQVLVTVFFAVAQALNLVRTSFFATGIVVTSIAEAMVGAFTLAFQAITHALFEVGRDIVKVFTKSISKVVDLLDQLATVMGQDGIAKSLQGWRKDIDNFDKAIPTVASNLQGLDDIAGSMRDGMSQATDEMFIFTAGSIEGVHAMEAMESAIKAVGDGLINVTNEASNMNLALSGGGEEGEKPVMDAPQFRFDEDSGGADGEKPSLLQSMFGFEWQSKLTDDLTVMNDAFAEAFGLTGDIVADTSSNIQNLLKSVFLETKSGIDSMMFDATKGSKNFEKIQKKFLDNILKATISSFTQQLLVMAQTTATGDAIRTASNQKNILGEAGTAGASAFSSVFEAVPFPLNVILAPIAAAGAFAGTMAFGSRETGDTDVAKTGPFILHKGERVVAQGVNEDLTAFLEKAQTGGGVGGDVILNIDTFIGDEEFTDEIASKISDSIELRNTDFRATEEVGGF